MHGPADARGRFLACLAPSLPRTLGARMVFSSNIFLFVFLPLFLASYYLTPWRWKSLHILVFSYGFYAWWRPDFLALLVGVTVGSYAVALAIGAAADKAGKRRWLTLGVAANLAALAYFKYANFGMDSLNAVLGWVGAPAIAFTHVLLPIGLSFYIFHALS